MFSVLDNALDKIETKTFNFREVQLGRSLIALAQIITLVLTKPSNLLAPQVGVPPFPHCEKGVQVVSIYCMPGVDSRCASILMLVILVWVVSGFFPRYSCFFHWWASLSMGISWSLPDGGEAIARIATLLLIPICLSHPSLNGWTRRPFTKDNKKSIIIAYVFIWSLRIEMAYIYADASISKFAVAEWVDGSAMYYIARGSMFGVYGPLSSLLLEITSNPVGVISLTWGALIIELVIGALILFSDKEVCRSSAIILDMLFHLGIGTLMGIWSFSIIMIGSVIVACTGFTSPDPD